MHPIAHTHTLPRPCLQTCEFSNPHLFTPSRRISVTHSILARFHRLEFHLLTRPCCSDWTIPTTFVFRRGLVCVSISLGNPLAIVELSFDLQQRNELHVRVPTMCCIKSSPSASLVQACPSTLFNMVCRPCSIFPLSKIWVNNASRKALCAKARR